MKKRTSKQQLLREQNRDAIALGIILPIVMLLSPGIWIIYLSLTRVSQLGHNALWLTIGILMCAIGCLVIGMTINEIRDNNKYYNQ